MEKDYMKQLSKWARWMLPWQEAEDVIADYHDIVCAQDAPPRSGEELLRDLGKPRDVVKTLSQPKQYRVWLASFAFMTVCILTLVIDPLFVGFPLWQLIFRHGIDIFFCYLLSVLGVAAALAWFRSQGIKTEHLPKAVPILLAILLVFVLGVVLFYWTCARSPDIWLEMWENLSSLPRFDNEPFYLPQLVICYICPVIILIGIYSLIKARTEDRRWAAVYVLAMAVVLICRMFLAWTHSMEMIDYEAAWQQLMLRFAVAAVTGLIGTGVALC